MDEWFGASWRRFGYVVASSVAIYASTIVTVRLAGRRKVAELLRGNDVGVLTGEHNVAARRQVGNFPETLSHLPLVNPARNLTRRPSRTGWQRGA